MRSLAPLMLAGVYFLAGAAAFAGATSTAPEVDPASLASIASGITGAYVAYRLFRARRALKNTSK